VGLRVGVDDVGEREGEDVGAALVGIRVGCEVVGDSVGGMDRQHVLLQSIFTTGSLHFPSL